MAKRKLKSFHFDLGNSTVGPIGMCARIRAMTRAEAVRRLKELLPEEFIAKNLLVHPEFWRGLCNDVIAPHYRIQGKAARILSDLCYSMPRGRCSLTVARRDSSVQSWAIYHGGDAPGTAGINGHLKAILRAFNL